MAAISVAEAKAALASFDWTTWSDSLQALYEPIYRAIVTSQIAHVATPAKAGPAPKTSRFMTAYIGKRITQISDTTREWATETIVSAIDHADDDLSVTDLASDLADAAEGSRAFDPARALTIARTEVATAYNHGSLLGYADNGSEHVLVSDGDGDDECAEADGAVWTIDEALADPLAHPNCERSFSPIAPGDEPDEDNE